MSKFNVHKWRAGAKKRMHQFAVLDPQVHAVMEKHGWHVICKATEDEDKREKWDWYMTKHPATDDEIFAKVDIKFGGVRDDHVKYFEKHGKSHGVTHYAFAKCNKARTKVIDEVRVVPVEYFMRVKVRKQNPISGEYYWVLPEKRHNVNTKTRRK